jgi:kynurenine formamidase
MLASLADEPKRLRALGDAVDGPRTTVRDNIDKLLQQELITEDNNRQYHVTTKGILALEAYRNYEQRIDVIERLEPFFRHAPASVLPDSIEWFAEMEIPLYGTDTVAAEQTISETTGTRLPLHPILLRDLGIVISEMNRLGDLAADCADDGQYEFLYAAAPMHVTGGTGGPVNPVAIK